MTSTFTKKIKLLYIPFLLSSVGLCVLYSFLNWLFIIKLQLFSIKEFIVDFGIPMALPAIPIFLYLRPKLKLLDLKTKKGSWGDFYIFILWFALAVPILIAQTYIQKASGKLSQLESISSIAKQEQTKYYEVKNFYIDKTNIGVHPSFDVSGKHNNDFNMHLYIVLPILNNEADTSNLSCSAWLGIEYYERISNSLEENEKEEKYQAFAKQSQEDFDKKDVSQFVYLDRVGNTEDGDGFKEATKKCTKYASANSPVFLSVNEPFEQRLGNTLAWIFGSFFIGASVWLLMILIPKFDQGAIARYEKGVPVKENDLKEFLDFLKPKEGYFITPILIYANVAIYLLMVFAGLGFMSFKGQDLLEWGANFRPQTMNGQGWRLLTSTFLHGGLIHLLANMYGLLFVGVVLEPLLGTKKYLIAYLVTGFLASCASIWWYEATVSVGASGAIFGLYGVFLALLLTKVFTPEFAKPFLISTSVFVGFNLLMGLGGGIDNAAHIGGLVFGLIIGFIFRGTLGEEDELAEDELVERQ
ncbi:MAG TPA: rhomboid family intramembrane serine protease [Cytophagaceae bacterium]|jgi:membrane associated rhomboid family serine protease